MTMPNAGRPDGALLTRYLLGACTEEEKVRVEEDFFGSQEIFDELCRIEEDLLDRYARGELSAEDRAQLQHTSRESPRRDRLLFHVALSRVAAEDSTGEARATSAARNGAAREAEARRSRQWWRWLSFEGAPARAVLAAACLLLAAGVALQLRSTRELRSTLEATRQDARALQERIAEADRRAAESEQRAGALAEQLTRERLARQEAVGSSRSQPIVATFVLTPGLTRSTGPARVLVPLAADTVRLRLELETDAYRGFRAELVTAAGDLVWSESQLQARGAASSRTVTLAVPATLLTNGHYEVVLRGRTTAGRLEDVAGYHFEIVRR